MNYKDINLHIIKCLFDKYDPIVRAQEVDENNILLIPSPAYYGYIIPRKKLYVSEGVLSMLDKGKPLFKVSEYCKPGNEIRPTNQFIEFGGEYCRRFENPEKRGAVYLKEKFLKEVHRGDEFNVRYYQNVQPGEDMGRKSVLVVTVEKDKDGNETYTPKLFVMPIDVKR